MAKAKLKTDKGMATYCGDTEHYSILIHVSPEPEGKMNLDYTGKLDVIISKLGIADQFFGSIDLDDVAGCRGLEFEDGIVLSSNDCVAIDEMCWAVLTEEYGIIPTELIITE